MHLFLIRHAHALSGEEDSTRPISPKGRKQIRNISRFLRDARAFDATEIWHSPLHRARDTANLLAKRLGSKAPINPVAGLTPDDSAGLIVKKLRNVHRPIAVIGHEPHLGALASLLVTGKAKPSRFVLKKCAVLRLDRIDGAWMVRWHVSPALV